MKTLLVIAMSTLAAVQLFAGDERDKPTTDRAQRATPSGAQSDAAAPRDLLTGKDKRVSEIPKPVGGPSEDGIYLGAEAALQQAYRAIAEADEAMEKPVPQVAQAKTTPSAEKDK
jgi:hypothetical protein